ncbi:hypothetical protein Zmor_010397 [Zophobas morio]|uniref:MADF domain-containing protein n=1 Tax=Zophobas morio TaxID=2755281 RepID=A0AA38MJY2_9CUCU|nr:hypothetical protein Zmor_010397 [Zophobas morio]
MQHKISDDIGNNFNEKLVELVGRHKILYDSTADGYSNFQLQDEMWRKIANELNEDVAACKLKWKNIRSCYTRYLRQIASQNCKITRTYYLAKHLRFLLPFCKPNTRQTVELYSQEDITNAVIQHENQEFDALEAITKCEPNDEDEASGNMELDANSDEDNLLEKRLINEEVHTNKRQTWETNSVYEICKKNKVCENTDEAELNFFRSLLPDIRKMNGKQRNQLKIAVLNAIDTILYSDDA